MTHELLVLGDQREIGRVRRDARGRLSIVYDEDWGSGTVDCKPLHLAAGGQQPAGELTFAPPDGERIGDFKPAPVVPGTVMLSHT